LGDLACVPELLVFFLSQIQLYEKSLMGRQIFKAQNHLSGQRLCLIDECVAMNFTEPEECLAVLRQ
jgi:hypothetical protein